MSIHRFIESSAAKLADDWLRTRRWMSGWMLPRNSIWDSHEFCDSFGSNSANTLSWVSSVWATFMSCS